MPNAFRKIARVGSLTGGTKWYLSEDCLLAAKRVMYAVEYRRFYLRDLESVLVWPNPHWVLRPAIPGVLIALVAAIFWKWVHPTAGIIIGSLALAWVALEVSLGPTARSQIRTAGGTVDMPLVVRTRAARKVLAKIDAAVRAARGALEQPTVVTQTAEPSVQSRSEASINASIATATETNAS